MHRGWRGRCGNTQTHISTHRHTKTSTGQGHTGIHRWSHTSSFTFTQTWRGTNRHVKDTYLVNLYEDTNGTKIGEKIWSSIIKVLYCLAKMCIFFSFSSFWNTSACLLLDAVIYQSTFALLTAAGWCLSVVSHVVLAGDIPAISF